MKTMVLLAALCACGGGSGAPDASPGGDGGAQDAPTLPPPQPYQVQISESEIGANGHTRREVLVSGFLADGTPASDEVVLSLDRDTAGTLGSTSLALGPRGASTSFTPCDVASADCLGAATISVALANAPTVSVARVALHLVTPADVSTAAPCQGTGGDVLYLDGITPNPLPFDMARIDDATWIASTPVNQLDLAAIPRDSLEGLGVGLSFQTSLDTSVPFHAGVYPHVPSVGSQTPGPGMGIDVNGAGCAGETGSFQVHDLALDASQHIRSITMSFEQTCPKSPPTTIEGCFYWTAP